MQFELCWSFFCYDSESSYSANRKLWGATADFNRKINPDRNVHRAYRNYQLQLVRSRCVKLTWQASEMVSCVHAANCFLNSLPRFMSSSA